MLDRMSYYNPLKYSIPQNALLLNVRVFKKKLIFFCSIIKFFSKVIQNFPKVGIIYSF
ncbi:unnamed protein product [Meloidogyne enterolobii]|uniref:Uncharacterized protein n=1 Tax=Meloidogyne enterolobii TaxID=390850 RepID=A0ACB1B2K0_MELEN